MEIVHEIQTRIKFFNAALKKRLTLRLATPYLDVLEGIRATRQPRSTVQPDTHNNMTRKALILESRVSRSTISRAQARTIGDASSLKLMSQVNSFLLDKSYEEAKVVKSFMENFDSIEKKDKSCVETTRNFLNSLKERIMDVRYQLLVEASPPFEPTVETQADAIGREVELVIERTVLLKLHDRIFDILAKPNKKDDAKIDQQMDVLQTKPQSYFGIPPTLEASSKWQLAVIEINEISSLFLPQEKLRAILNCIAAIVDTAQFESDRRLKEQFRLANAQFTHATTTAATTTTNNATSASSSLNSSPSTASTVASSSMKPESPQSSVTSLSPPASDPSIPTSTSSLSTSSLSAPTSSSSGVVSSTSPTGSNFLSPHATSPTPIVSKPVDLSADDLLPILIYVLVHSKLVRLETQCQYMWQMSDPADLVGESGYYLTMLSSAVEYLKQHEEESSASAPPQSQPVKISGTHAGLHPGPTLFDDSDSDDDLTPPSPTVGIPAGNTTWIGSKSGALSGDTPSSSTSPTSSFTSRPNRQSMFVIGSTRSNNFFNQRSNSPSTSSTPDTTDSLGSPPSSVPDAF